MPVFLLTEDLLFPDPEEADEEHGLVAVGGDLRPERVLLAYRSGIFPWPHEGYPLLWFSPEPRALLYPSRLRVNRSLRKRLRRATYEITLDQALPEVMLACGEAPRPEGPGTWIDAPMRRAYGELHRQGYVHSAEAWLDGRLVGGVYGLSLGAVFCGESMFAAAPDASKVAFVFLVRQLQRWGCSFVDCQVLTPHLERFGAVEVGRADFLNQLKLALHTPTRLGPWELEIGPQEVLSGGAVDES